MATAHTDVVAVASQRGGMNEADSPFTLRPDECVLARNIEFFAAACGERRLGCGPLDLGTSTLSAETLGVHGDQWFPTNDVLSPEWFLVAATPGTSIKAAMRAPTGTWTDLTFTDAPVNSSPAVYQWDTEALNGALFVAYVSAQNRMHIKRANSTVVTRAGLAEPPVGSAANSGAAGAYAAVLRYYRYRLAIQVSGVTVVRSEPSDAVAFTPDGAHTSATFTRGTTPSGEVPTHWEMEASEDGNDFYRLSTIAIGTTTYVDTAAPSTYATTGVLSEDIGENDLLPAAKYLLVDGDRLVLLGHETDTEHQCDVSWTPVTGDPGIGNAERLPLSANNTRVLDNFNGGAITGGASVALRSFVIFKWQRIYIAVRTGDPTNAYDIDCISTTNGAIPGSVVPGVDAGGAACIFFLDPNDGPCMLGQGGIQKIWGLRKTWKRVNRNAVVTARSCYYADKQQIRWAVAIDGNTRPNFGITVQVSELRPRDTGSVSGGLSVWDGRMTEATCMFVLTEMVNIDGLDQVSNRPFVGLTFPDGFQRCDTLDEDAGVEYTSTLRTRPLTIVGLLQQWGVLSTAIATTANVSASMNVRLIRDFGVDENPQDVSLSPDEDEDYVIKVLSESTISEMTALQLEFSDA